MLVRVPEARLVAGFALGRELLSGHFLKDFFLGQPCNGISMRMRDAQMHQFDTVLAVIE